MLHTVHANNILSFTNMISTKYLFCIEIIQDIDILSIKYICVWKIIYLINMTTQRNLGKILASINYSLVWSRIRVEIWSVRRGSWWHGARSRLAHTRWTLPPTAPGNYFSISLSRRNIFIFPVNKRSSECFTLIGIRPMKNN